MKKKTILLIGLGRFGLHIAKKLHELGHEIMAVDVNEEKINQAVPFVTYAQIGNSTNEDFLKSLGINNYDLCIVTISDDFQSSLETTSLLKELGAKKVISRAERDGQAKFLLRNGADEIVYPEKQLASWMAIKYSADHILDYIEIDNEHSIFEVSVPKEWIGKTIGEIDIRKLYGINILGIKDENKLSVDVIPSKVLSSELSLLVIVDYKKIQKCFKI